MVTRGEMDLRLGNTAIAPTQQTSGSTNSESSPTKPCPVTQHERQGKEQPAASALRAVIPVTVTVND